MYQIGRLVNDDPLKRIHFYVNPLVELVEALTFVCHMTGFTQADCMSTQTQLQTDVQKGEEFIFY